MINKIKLGIVGYGNLGKGVEAVIKNAADMELIGIFSRRDPSQLKTISGVPAYTIDELNKMADSIDILVICGGSATDLPEMTPALAKLCNVIDSFDTHAKIPEHFMNVDAAAKAFHKLAAISVGWDPGMFSLNRMLARAILPNGKDYTFWGTGVSQGHSDAIRRIDGVVDARQYTVPVDSAVEKVRSGETPEFTTREKHTRLCYVVAEEGTDTAAIEAEIVSMPNYFSDYDTTVNFISAEEMKENHSTLPHGGLVLHSGKTGFENENTQIIEYKLSLDSNPEFTASVLVAYARATVKLAREGKTGCITVFDVPPAYLIDMTAEDMRAKLL